MSSVHSRSFLARRVVGLVSAIAAASVLVWAPARARADTACVGPPNGCFHITRAWGAASTEAVYFGFNSTPEPMPANAPWGKLPGQEGWHISVPVDNTVSSFDFLIRDPTTNQLQAQLPSMAVSLGPGEYDLAANLQLPAGLANGPHVLELVANGSILAPNPTPPGGYGWAPWVSTYSVWLRLDSQAPAPPVVTATVQGDAWRSSPGFTIRLTKPTEDLAIQAPISAVVYRLCAASDRAHCTAPQTAPPVDGRASTVTIPVTAPGPGTFIVDAWFKDAAGNDNAELDNDDARIRFDPTPPALDGFAADDPADPTDIEVQGSDSTSGIGDGEIDYQVIGRSVWHALPTTVTQSGLSARLDDSAVPRAELRFRAVAADLAGNSAATSRLAGGDQDFVLRAPLRQATRLGLSARHVLRATRKRCHRVRGHRHCVTVFRAPTTQRPTSIHIAFGHRRRLHGLLTTNQGHPIAGATIAATLKPDLANASPQTITARTDENGQFVLTVPAGPSRTMSIDYGGAAHLQPAHRGLRALTRGRVTLSVEPRRVKEPGDVRLTGRVVGGPLPSGGKLVALEAWVGDRWQPFATVHTDAAGQFAYVKPIEHSPRGVYRLRATLPREAAYPYAGGRSRVARVLVH